MKKCIYAAVGFAIVLWWLKLWEVFLSRDLYQLGVYPRTLSGLIGIVTGPLVHGSWQHVISNTLPLVLLGSVLLYGYPRSRWWTLGIIWLLSGAGVWLFARDSYHFGASGLTHGMFFFLFVSGILRRDRRSIGLLMVAFFMYGGMLMTIFPREPGISYEYHFFGALAGALSALAFRRWDPKSVRKIYSWERHADEDEALEEEDPVIGDLWKTTEDNPPDDSSERD